MNIFSLIGALLVSAVSGLHTQNAITTSNGSYYNIQENKDNNDNITSRNGYFDYGSYDWGYTLPTGIQSTGINIVSYYTLFTKDNVIFSEAYLQSMATDSTNWYGLFTNQMLLDLSAEGNYYCGFLDTLLFRYTLPYQKQCFYYWLRIPFFSPSIVNCGFTMSILDSLPYGYDEYQVDRLSYFVPFEYSYVNTTNDINQYTIGLMISFNNSIYPQVTTDYIPYTGTLLPDSAYPEIPVNTSGVTLRFYPYCLAYLPYQPQEYVTSATGYRGGLKVFNNDWNISDLYDGMRHTPNCSFNMDYTFTTHAVADAYQDGYSDGRNSGYQEGYNVGTSTAEAEYSSYYQDGYNAGVLEASSQDSTALTIFTGIINVGLLPINVFLSVLNFEVFGINIGGLVSSFLTIAIVIILWRIISGNKND